MWWFSCACREGVAGIKAGQRRQSTVPAKAGTVRVISFKTFQVELFQSQMATDKSAHRLALQKTESESNEMV
jgi:hypothetical protein